MLAGGADQLHESVFMRGGTDRGRVGSDCGSLRYQVSCHGDFEFWKLPWKLIFKIILISMVII